MLRFALAFVALTAGCTDPDDDDDDTIGDDGDGDADADLALLPCSARSDRDDGQAGLREFSYDAEGRLEIERIWSDYPTDGIWDDVRLETHSYGEHGVDTESHDAGADCLSEYSFQYDYRHRQLPEGPDLTFDDHGNVLTSEGEHHDCTYEYDDHDNLVLEDCLLELPIADTPDWELVHRVVEWNWMYDLAGHEIALDVDQEHADEHWRWTWNEDGRRVREESWQDNSGAGPETFEWTYDAEGRLATEVHEGSYGGRTETTFSYDCWDTGGPDVDAIACARFRESAERYLAVSIGGLSGCGIEVDGGLACWGFIDLDPPAGEYVALSSGDQRACAVRAADGSIDCFELFSGGERDPWIPPDGAFASLDVDKYHGCGLREDGSIGCWGEDNDGSTRPPEGMFSLVAVGRLTSCALDEDGLAVCWGRNNYGQADAPTDVPFRHLAVGLNHGCAVTLEGALLCWGDATPTEAGVYTQVAVARHESPATCALREGGSVACWGELSFAPEGQFTSITMTERAACGLRDDQRVVCWGDNALHATTPP